MVVREAVRYPEMSISSEQPAVETGPWAVGFLAAHVAIRLAGERLGPILEGLAHLGSFLSGVAAFTLAGMALHKHFKQRRR